MTLKSISIRSLRAVFLVLFSLGFCLSRPLAGSAPKPGGIEWQPWTENLFDVAKKEKKLVILDLEAVWCHWCHVMEDITYADPKVRELIKKNYIAVRVDQDSRPDLSNRYEDYGWPATIFFDSNGKELAKRSGYIPPKPMASLLQAFVDDPTPGPSVREEEKIAFNDKGALPENLKAQMEQDYKATYDKELGGWGTVHKYVDPDSIEYSLARAAEGDLGAEGMARKTLDANLVLIDPAWGGVYQYSAGGTWDEPHFEKIMSYQTGDMRVYSQAYAMYGKESDLKAAQDIHRFLTGFLLSPEGAFYTSQDADIIQGQHSEGYFKLPDAERRKQGIPIIDKHIYSRENGWAIEALVSLYTVTRDEMTLDQAKKAAAWILKNRSLGAGGFRHDEQDKAGPYLGDTLGMAKGFLALYSVTADREWLARATDATGYIEIHFKDAQAGYLTSRRSTGGFQPKQQRDENVALGRFSNLLFHYTGNETYKKMAEHAMKYLSAPSIARRRPTASVLLLDRELSEDPPHLTVIGSKKDPAALALFQAALKANPISYRRLEWWDRSEGPLPNPDVQYPELSKAAAFVCVNKRCSLPLTTPEKVLSKLKPN